MVATQVSPASLKEVSAGLKVIDTDTHVTEPADLWTSRVPASLRDRVPQVKVFDGVEKWMIGDQEFGTIGTSVVGKDGSKLSGKMSHDRIADMSAAAYDPIARLKLMDELGLWAQIIYPNASGFQSGKFLQMPDREAALACTKAYNDFLAEWQQVSNGRLLGQALLPVWDRDELMKELRRTSEDLKLSGISIGDKPEHLGMPGYLEDYWAPFWEYCSSNKVPVNFHIGGAVGVDAFAAPWSAYGFERNVAIAATLFYMSNAATMANFLMSGLFDTYPGLQMVSVESGLGWIPFVLEALEYQLDEMIPTECKHLQRRPKEYFRDHYKVCFWFEEFGPMHMLDYIGVNNVLFMTDFPHPTCLYPKSQEHLVKVLGGLPFEKRKRVLQDNAAELYRIPV